MRKFFSLTLLVLISLVSTPNVLFAQTNGDTSEVVARKIVKAIEVEGNKTISIATVLSRIKTRVGQDYIQTVVSDDLKRLYNTGYFSDVRVDRQEYDGGFKVIIFLDEKPLIEEVTFSKTRFIKSKVLKRKIKTQSGKFLDNKDLKDDLDIIKELYEQKGLTNANVDVEKFVDETTNKATLHFVVREGQKVQVKGINVYGNASYKDKKIIGILKTKPRWLVFRKGYLNEEVIAEDMERIVSFYEQEGYIDASADFTIESLAKGYTNINIEIDEGRRYWVGDVDFKGNDVISDREIVRIMEDIQEGGIFSRDKLSLDLSKIRSLYFDRGYIFAKVEETTSLDSDTGKVEVKVDIIEGDVAYIERVKVEGNSRTKDIVIRRELRLYPGDRFDGARLKKSRQRLTDLGYFEDVAFDIEDTDEYDRKNLVVQVKEAKTGTFSFGGGFSTVDQLVGFIEVEQRNFDATNWPTFTGGGQHLSFRAETGSTRNNLQLTFTEPWLFNRPISGGFDVFRTERDRDDDNGYAYDEERIGGVLRLGKRFSDEFSAGTSYRREEVKIGNFAAGASADLLAEAGENTVSVLGFTAAHDRRDSHIAPTKGYLVSSGFDVAGGFLGGDKDFYRVDMAGSYYVPLKFKSVLELRVRGGIVNDYGDSTKVPIFEKFFVGGARTIRGYDERGVGPQDAVTKDPIGGEALFVANVEYTIPLIQYIKLAAFFDVGNVWAKTGDFLSGNFKSGTGLGLRVKTPIGPINLDYGYPLNDEPGETDRSGKFYFSVSRGF